MYYVTPPSVIAVGVLLPLLAASAVGLRFYARRTRHVGFGVDDWLVLGSLVLAVGCGIILIYGAAAGGLAEPTPLGDGPVEGLPGYFFVMDKALAITWRCKFAFNLLQILSFGAVKMSVICFYRRIFRGKLFDVASKALMGVVALWTVAFFFVVLFQCGTDFGALWSTLFDFVTHCLPDVVYLEGNSISDIITDVLILLLPAPMIWNLQLSLSKKFALCGVFFMGFLAVAAGAGRLAIFLLYLTDSFSQSQGIMIMTTYLYWTMIELSISITAACLPTLKPSLNSHSFRRLSESLQGLFSAHSSATRKSSGSSGSSDGATRSIGSAETARETCQELDLGQRKGCTLGTNIEALPDVEAAMGALPHDRIFVENDISSRYSDV